MKGLTTLCFAFFLIGVMMFLTQLWLHVWTPELYIKIAITDAALFIVSFVVTFIIKENKISENINKGSSLD